MDNLQEVYNQLDQFGIAVQDKDRSKIERFDDGKKYTIGKGGKAWCKFYRFTPRGSHRVLITGSFGSYKTSDWARVELSGGKLSDDELSRLRREREAADAAASMARSLAAKRAAMSAEQRWSMASKSGESAYAAKKGVSDVRGPWVRFEGGTLLVPMCRYDQDRTLRGLQSIDTAGAKKYTFAVDKKGCAAVIGHHSVGDPIFIGEGWATMATVWLALEKKFQCVVAFDCGNLLPAAQMMATARPDAPMIVCADDDYATDGNPGRAKAAEVHKTVDASVGVLVPFFADRKGRKLTDFNDLHVTAGLPEVARQLGAALREMRKIGALA